MRKVIYILLIIMALSACNLEPESQNPTESISDDASHSNSVETESNPAAPSEVPSQVPSIPDNTSSTQPSRPNSSTGFISKPFDTNILIPPSYDDPNSNLAQIYTSDETQLSYHLKKEDMIDFVNSIDFLDFVEVEQGTYSFSDLRDSDINYIELSSSNGFVSIYKQIDEALLVLYNDTAEIIGERYYIIPSGLYNDVMEQAIVFQEKSFNPNSSSETTNDKPDPNTDKPPVNVG